MINTDVTLEIEITDEFAEALARVVRRLARSRARNAAVDFAEDHDEVARCRRIWTESQVFLCELYVASTPEGREVRRFPVDDAAWAKAMLVAAKGRWRQKGA